ncbi:hypothetical protein [Qipengyuania sp.]|uniref:hypothetical protein n=1 Tax=Qipengyuania sp. TaxID=2004515 RepID=UPI003AF80DF6
MAIKAINIVSFGLLLIVAVMMGSFLPRSLDSYEVRPDDLWSVLRWLGLLLFLAGTSFWNALALPDHPRRMQAQILPNAATLIAYGYASTQAYGRLEVGAILIVALGPLAWLVGKVTSHA